MKHYRYYLVNIVAPLILGAVLYFVLDPNVFFMRSLCNEMHIESSRIRQMLLTLFLRNYFIDVLWAYSLTFAVEFVVRNVIVAAGISVVFLTMIELSQLYFEFGTFDFVDIVCEVLSVAFAIYIIRKTKEGGVF